MPLPGDLFDGYHVNGKILDEIFAEPTSFHPHYGKIVNYFSELGVKDFHILHDYAKNTSFNQGITFNVYSEAQEGTERIFPFDLFPRIIPRHEWDILEAGVKQRNTAINLFLKDLYHKQQVLKDKVLPPELVSSSHFFVEQMKEFQPPGDIYTHISGTDLIKHRDGHFYVLEDNLRCPSGVSYVLSNRTTLKKTFPNLFFNYNVMPVSDYPEQLLQMMESMAPEGLQEPTCVVLTPGMFNSAYFEHVFLASQMGIQLVEGRDLFVENDFVYMKTIRGPQRIDVIYRRVDDDFLDPEVFRKDSLLGVKGLMRAYLQGNVTLVNAPGTGIADDKAVYSYMPEIIRYYLGEDPILHNVQTYRCIKKDECQHVLENLHELVVKPVDESGGYGILMGHQATQQERDAYRERIKADPRKYIAQPVMSLSVHATFIEDRKAFEPRHIDLRIFSILSKDNMFVNKGGLTRVALRKGNLIVNSSQGGGSKDTWVLERNA